MIKKKYKAQVDNGKLILKEKDIFKKELIRYEGKEVTITIGPKDYSQRSNPQNSYLWGCVYKMIGEHTGYTDDEIHELMKSMFLKKHLEIKLKDKIERYTIVGSTTSLNTAEFGEYIDKIRDWASLKFQLYIPNPDEAEYN